MSRGVVMGILGALILVAGISAAGYAIGSGSAPDASDAWQSRRESYRTAYPPAVADARDRSRGRARVEGLAHGRERGRQQGVEAGSKAGEADADAQLATTETQSAPEPAAVVPPPGSTYDDQLPNGRPGYILPEDQRSISCIGVDAATGQCVGD